MEPTTLRLPPDLLEDLADEADEHGYSSRAEYIRHILRGRSGADPATSPTTDVPDPATDPTTSATTDVTGPATNVSGPTTDEFDNLRDRVDELEERLAALKEGGGTDEETVAAAERGHTRRETPPIGPDDHSSPADTAARKGGDAVHQYMEETHREPNDALTEDVRAYIEEQDLPPKSKHGRRAVVDVFRQLRQHGTMGTGDLQEEVYPEYEDYWAGPRAMWNAIDRYLEDIPGIEKGGYGEWDYTGDDNVRRTLEQAC